MIDFVKLLNVKIIINGIGCFLKQKEQLIDGIPVYKYVEWPGINFTRLHGCIKIIRLKNNKYIRW